MDKRTFRHDEAVPGYAAAVNSLLENRGFLSVRRAAARLGVSRQAVYYAMRKGLLPMEWRLVPQLMVATKDLSKYRVNHNKVEAGEARQARRRRT